MNKSINTTYVYASILSACQSQTYYTSSLNSKKIVSITFSKNIYIHFSFFLRNHIHLSIEHIILNVKYEIELNTIMKAYIFCIYCFILHLSTSYIKRPAATDAFSDSLLPSIGIFTNSFEIAATLSLIPFASFPTIIPILSL